MPRRPPVPPVNTFMLEGPFNQRIRDFADRENRTYANAVKTLILRGLASSSKLDAKWLAARRVAEPSVAHRNAIVETELRAKLRSLRST